MTDFCDVAPRSLVEVSQMFAVFQQSDNGGSTVHTNFDFNETVLLEGTNCPCGTLAPVSCLLG